MPLPAAFVPAPFALPGSTQALEKQLANLLRKLEPVQAAEVLIAGDEAQGVTVRVILKARAGGRLTPEIIGTMSQMLSGAAPGITPSRLIIADNAGRLLYDRGQPVVQSPAEPLAHTAWLWLAFAALAALAAAWLTVQAPLRRQRAPTRSLPAEGAWWEQADPRLMTEILARERPEVAALVLSGMPGGRERRLRRLLRRRGMEPPVLESAVDPKVVQVVLRTLESGMPPRHASER
ncbi:MAG: hypothetical protein WCP21_11810 [Armatimonadota bacterium]